MRYARKRDQSESLIVAALRMIGCDVEIGQDTDLYVRCPKGNAYLLECKTPGPNVKRRQPIQGRLAMIFGDQYKFVTDTTSALKAIGYYS